MKSLKNKETKKKIMMKVIKNKMFSSLKKPTLFQVRGQTDQQQQDVVVVKRLLHQMDSWVHLK
jgi:hypothetical protein